MYAVTSRSVNPSARSRSKHRYDTSHCPTSFLDIDSPHTPLLPTGTHMLSLSEPEPHSPPFESFFTSFARVFKSKPKERTNQNPKRSLPPGTYAAKKMRSMPAIRGRNKTAASFLDLDGYNGMSNTEHHGGGDFYLESVDTNGRMEMNDCSLGPAPYAHQTSTQGQNPFDTPPDTPLMGFGAMESSQDAKCRSAERSGLKSIQILGPEASPAVKLQYGRPV